MNNGEIKDKPNPQTSILNVRCTPREKETWVKIAGSRKLSQWVKTALNHAAKK